MDCQPHQERQTGRKDRLSAGPRRDGAAEVVAVPAADREDQGAVLQEPDASDQRGEEEEGAGPAQLGNRRILIERIFLVFEHFERKKCFSFFVAIKLISIKL